MIIGAVAKSKGQRFHFLGQRRILPFKSSVAKEFCSAFWVIANRLAKVVNQKYRFMKAQREGIFGDFR
jgi:hypothetical protein